MSAVVPPLNALKAFEAVVRTGTVRAAAVELCVTPGAVSLQLKVLQEAVRTPLWTRSGRTLTPTADAARYAQAVGAAFGTLRHATAELRRGRVNGLTVS